MFSQGLGETEVFKNEKVIKEAGYITIEGQKYELWRNIKKKLWTKEELEEMTKLRHKEIIEQLDKEMPGWDKREVEMLEGPNEEDENEDKTVLTITPTGYYYEEDNGDGTYFMEGEEGEEPAWEKEKNKQEARYQHILEHIKTWRSKRNQTL